MEAAFVNTVHPGDVVVVAVNGLFGQRMTDVAARCGAEVVAVDNVTAALNYGLNKVRFPAPVPVGSKVRATVTLTAAQRKQAGVEAVFGLVYETEGGSRPACVADVVVLYR